MANNVMYRCSNCGHESKKWYGKCFTCNEFNTLEEIASTEVANEASKAGYKSSGSLKPAVKAASIKSLKNKPIHRTPTGIGELDRVLGGGFVDGEVVLMAAQPGAGKSTLSLRVAEKFALLGKTVLYSSGEESEQQIGLRAKRMGIDHDNIKVVNETNLETLFGHIEDEKPEFVIVDSLQTIASVGVSGSMGSISQSKEAAHSLTALAKSKNISMILISQVVKSGDFSGSESVQHIVDCCLMMESDSETPLKFLRATKNRFGDTTEVGVFQHGETGLEEVTDPSGIFLETDSDDVSGAACSFLSEGIRQIPVEVQALVSHSTLANPRKQFSGINFQRGQIVCAILDKFCSAKLFENDVFISTVSGLKVVDPQADLSIAAAILSSIKNKPIDNTKVFIGELSLTGQVRGSFMIEQKLKEAERLGFTDAYIPYSALSRVNTKNTPKLNVHAIKSVKEVLEALN